jgi:hypothetical protein
MPQELGLGSTRSIIRGYFMRKLITLSLTLLSFSFSSAFAQQDSLAWSPTKAISFTFSGLNLGGGLAGKLLLGNGYWLRPEFTFSSQSDKTNIPLIDSLSTNHDYSQSQFNLAVTLEKHFSLTSELSPYVGVSGGMTSTLYHDTYTYVSHTYDSKQLWYGVQGEILIGVEYWLTKHISLAGEHIVILNYSWNNIDHRTTVTFGTSNSSLLLSIYL